MGKGKVFSTSGSLYVVKTLCPNSLIITDYRRNVLFSSVVCLTLSWEKLNSQSYFTQEEDVVFIETHKQLRKQHHMIIECIPLPKEVGDMSPVYFKVGP